MIITSEEHLMYQVMKAIFESGIPISFKGSMVLKAFLMDAGFSEETRHTVDIDGNWNSDSLPSAEQMVESWTGWYILKRFSMWKNRALRIRISPVQQEGCRLLARSSVSGLLNPATVPFAESDAGCVSPRPAVRRA